MCIDLFKIGPLTVHAYGLLIGIGFLCAVIFGALAAKRKGLSGDAVYSIGIIAILTGFLGGKLLYCIVEWKAFIQNPMSVLGTSGFVVYGGIIVGCLCVILYCRLKKYDTVAYFDTLIPFVALAQGFGRIGCFMAGCCYGRPTDSFFGVVFPESGLAPSGIPLLPTQLFSAAGDFLLFALLLLVGRKIKTPGHLSSLYLSCYSVGRFVIEIFRADDRGTVLEMSTSQFVSILIFALSVVLFFAFSRHAKKKADTGEYHSITEKEEPAETQPDSADENN